MRKIVLLCLFFVFSATSLWAQNAPVAGSTNPQATKSDSLLPYQKYPQLPAFNIRLMDSVTVFNTYNIPGGKPIAIVFFDPGCKHCKHSIGGLLQNMDSVKNVQFYFITPVHDLKALRDFYATYHMADYKNIQVVGRDYEFFFFSYYGSKSVPDVALYDGKKKLVKLIEGEFTASEVYKYVH
jgi:thiol-disulfide isomerase/thioredoxin